MRSTSFVLLAILAAGALPALATVTVTFDAATLNQLLPVVAPDRFLVSLAGTQVTVHVEELKVTGFDPAGGARGDGVVLASARIRIPQLGIDTQVEPHLAFVPRPMETPPAIELRFERFPVRMPLAGSVDVAGMIPAQLFPGGGTSALEGAHSDAEIQTKVVAVRVGRDAVRIELDVTAVPKRAG
jgi:hypothetical protein